MGQVAAVASIASTVISAVGSAKKASSQRKQAVQEGNLRRSQAAADAEAARIGAELEEAESEALARAELEAGKAAYELGLDQETAANFEAKQYEYQAGQERASAQRAAIEERRLARIKQSRAVALAAASGGGAADPSIVDLLADIEGYGEYEALAALYEGGERARGMETAALIRRFEGKQAKKAGEITLDASRQRYVDILTSGRRRARAMLESGRTAAQLGIRSANVVEAAGRAQASGTIWQGIASTVGRAGSLYERYGGGGSKLSYIDKSTIPDYR